MTNNIIHLRILVSLGLLLLTVSACSPGASNSLNVGLYSNQETVPYPRFTVLDPTRKGERPQFADISIYHESGGCKVPNCPIVWRALVSNHASPPEIRYGQLEEVGASYLVAPERLLEGERYRLVVGPDGKSDFVSKTGELGFMITNQGMVQTTK